MDRQRDMSQISPGKPLGARTLRDQGEALTGLGSGSESPQLGTQRPGRIQRGLGQVLLGGGQALRDAHFSNIDFGKYNYC